MATLASRRPIDSPRVVRPRGQVYTIPVRCKGCKFCIEFCPEDVLQESPQMNSKGYHFPMVAPGKEASCVQCGFCTLVCPEMAIFTLEVTGA
ncbi:MAG: 4Fe-4S binding protein [Chloroflexi bacterium]|nr:4Fe-4S binding protein [Chloroflexota bacterium]